MKQSTLLIAGLFICTFTFCQVETKSNSGIVIVQAQGVPNSASPKSNRSENQIRTVSDWNLAECYEALRMIEEKINHFSKEDENYAQTMKYYDEEKIRINKQIEKLKSTKP